MKRALDRLLSLGQSEAVPDRLARHVRVTNALALVGVVLSVASIPLDALGAPLLVLVNDIVSVAAFASCWLLNARGHRTASRVLLMLIANIVILSGVIAIGAVAELRTMFFPIALMPFLVFSVSEVRWLAVFSALPVVAYFVTGQMELPPPHLALSVYTVYAPVLAFAMIIIGTAVFALIDRNTEDKLLHARARAAQSARLAALGEMSSGIAHEIRNPLAAIHLAATQIVANPDDPAQVAQLGERIQRIVMRGARIIEGLRAFSRDATGDPFVATPVARILHDTLELCGKRLTDNGITLTVEAVPPDLVVECRPVQLSQVLMNLIGNAYDAVASAKERWVRIDVHGDGDLLELAVADSGPGIPPATRARLFEPFFTTKAPDRGTGIGLSLSRGLVAAHHGTLELDPTSPNTRFVIRLPRAQPREAAESDARAQ